MDERRPGLGNAAVAEPTIDRTNPDVTRSLKRGLIDQVGDLRSRLLAVRQGMDNLSAMNQLPKERVAQLRASVDQDLATLAEEQSKVSRLADSEIDDAQSYLDQVRDRVTQLEGPAREQLDRTQPIPEYTQERTREREQTELTEGQRWHRRTQAQQTLGCLGANGNADCDAALNQRVNELSPGINVERANPEQLQDIDRQIAANIRSRWTPAQRRDNLQLSDREVIERAVRDGENLDDLLRQAVVRNRVDQLSREARRRRDELIAKAKNRANGRRGKALKLVGGTAAGILGGTIIRHLAQQGLIQAGSHGARFISGAGGAIAGAVVGGFIGFRRSKESVYSNQSMVTDVETMRANGEITEEEAQALYEQLLKDNKVRGHEQEAYEAIEAIATARAQRELQETIDRINNEPPIPGETDAQKRQRIAIAFAQLQQQHIAPNGSELKRNEHIMDFLTTRKREVGKGAAIGALQWGVFGGIFGALFPAPGLESQLHARDFAHHMKDLPQHFGSPQQANDALDHINQLHQQFGNTPQTNEAITRYIQEQGYNHKDLQALFLDQNPERYHELAKQIGYRMGLDLTHTVPGHGTLWEFSREYAHNYVQANGGMDENGVRGLFHILSHPDTLGKHWNDLLNIVKDSHNLSGHDFTARVIHGGTPWWQPFTGGLMPGHDFSNDMSASARHFITNRGPGHALNAITQWPWVLNTETPWFPFAAWVMSSGDARWLRDKGGKGVDKLKELFDKESKKKEKKEYLSDTGVERFDKRMFDYKDYENDPTLQAELVKQLTQFKQRIPARHGQFFFIKDGDQVRAFRLWPYNNDRARQDFKVNKYVPEDQNVFGDIGDPSLTLLHEGQIQVKEYSLDELSDAPIDEKSLKDYWDLPQWGTKKKVPFSLNFKQLFRADGPTNAKQLFISPLDVHKYARGFRENKLDGLNINVDDFNPLEPLTATPAEPAAETAAEQPIETETPTPATDGTEKKDATATEAPAGEPAKPEIITSVDQLKPGMVIRQPGAEYVTRLLEKKKNGHWRFSSYQIDDIDGTYEVSEGDYDPKNFVEQQWEIYKQPGEGETPPELKAEPEQKTTIETPVAETEKETNEAKTELPKTKAEGSKVAELVMNPAAQKAHDMIKAKFPQLGEIDLQNFTTEFVTDNPRILANYTHPKTGERPMISFRGDWQEAVAIPKTELGRPLLEHLATKLNVPTDQLSDDMLSVFMLAHEFGHANDHAGKSVMEQQKQRDSEIVGLPAANMDDFLKKYPTATMEQMHDFQRKYRALPSEVAADEFALSFMNENFEALFGPRPVVEPEKKAPDETNPETREQILKSIILGEPGPVWIYAHNKKHRVNKKSAQDMPNVIDLENGVVIPIERVTKITKGDGSLLYEKPAI